MTTDTENLEPENLRPWPMPAVSPSVTPAPTATPVRTATPHNNRRRQRRAMLDGGRVAEQGTPAELIAAGGWFAEFAPDSGEGAEEAEEESEQEDEE